MSSCPPNIARENSDPGGFRLATQDADPLAAQQRLAFGAGDIQIDPNRTVVVS